MSNMQAAPLQLIFKGRLEFGSERTFNMVLNHWNTRVENYFKADVLLKADEVFNAESYTLDVPQQVVMSTEKHWRSTTALLREIAQYALAGNVGAWWVNSGQVLAQYTIEPQSDKTAVAEFIRGRELVQQGGMEMASEALSNAISKFERNALAYERRGYVNYKLKNFKDALYDFTKSINVNPNNPEPYYGRGKVKMIMNDWESAVGDFDAAIKGSLAVQPMHWLARLRKAECLFHAKRFAEAIPELKLFLQKQFPETHPAFRFKAKAEYLMAESVNSAKS
jgi:tetratricopeptide (TPR) repeat protein